MTKLCQVEQVKQECIVSLLIYNNFAFVLNQSICYFTEFLFKKKKKHIQSCGKHCSKAQGVMHLTILLVQLCMHVYIFRPSSKSTNVHLSGQNILFCFFAFFTYTVFKNPQGGRNEIL